MLGCLIYLNYWQHVEKKYVAAATTKLGRFIGYYLLYLIPFAGAFFLQLLFYKDCSYYKNGWFWAILVLAPAFFSFRINFNWQQGWIKDHYTGVAQAFYLQSINWIVRVFILLIPVFIIWVLKDKGTQPFYGSVPLASVTPYLWMLLIMLPLIALASTQADFLKVYPKAAFINKIPTHSWQDGWRYMAYELCYGFDFISIEFFFGAF